MALGNIVDLKGFWLNEREKSERSYSLICQADCSLFLYFLIVEFLFSFLGYIECELSILFFTPPSFLQNLKEKDYI